ncbi:unnamed protein product [Moneuplotes crassus]|uniref:Uncharacterized protein n=1 Tax=Euplotes crassus TaxID=5936 RepID=A0AAD1TZQ1_EUPCR|nr:unnamed protein product [Moneuplotes crassus]
MSDYLNDALEPILGKRKSCAYLIRIHHEKTLSTSFNIKKKLEVSVTGYLRNSSLKTRPTNQQRRNVVIDFENCKLKEEDKFKMLPVKYLDKKLARNEGKTLRQIMKKISHRKMSTMNPIVAERLESPESAPKNLVSCNTLKRESTGTSTLEGDRNKVLLSRQSSKRRIRTKKSFKYVVEKTLNLNHSSTTVSARNNRYNPVKKIILKKFIQSKIKYLNYLICKRALCHQLLTLAYQIFDKYTSLNKSEEIKQEELKNESGKYRIILKTKKIKELQDAIEANIPKNESQRESNNSVRSNSILTGRKGFRAEKKMMKRIINLNSSNTLEDKLTFSAKDPEEKKIKKILTRAWIKEGDILTNDGGVQIYKKIKKLSSKKMLRNKKVSNRNSVDFFHSLSLNNSERTRDFKSFAQPQSNKLPNLGRKTKKIFLTAKRHKLRNSKLFSSLLTRPASLNESKRYVSYDHFLQKSPLKSTTNDLKEVMKRRKRDLGTMLINSMKKEISKYGQKQIGRFGNLD